MNRTSQLISAHFLKQGLSTSAFVFGLAFILCSPHSAFAVADSIYCIVEMNPAKGMHHSARKAVLIEGISHPQPSLTFYGFQSMPLRKSISGPVFDLDAKASLFRFKIDLERKRIVVNKKKSADGANLQGEIDESGAGNCTAI